MKPHRAPPLRECSEVWACECFACGISRTRAADDVAYVLADLERMPAFPSQEWTISEATLRALLKLEGPKA